MIRARVPVHVHQALLRGEPERLRPFGIQPADRLQIAADLDLKAEPARILDRRQQRAGAPVLAVVCTAGRRLGEPLATDQDGEIALDLALEGR
jgi:hypothetical protein